MATCWCVLLELLFSRCSPVTKSCPRLSRRQLYTSRASTASCSTPSPARHTRSLAHSLHAAAAAALQHPLDLSSPSLAKWRTVTAIGLGFPQFIYLLTKPRWNVRGLINRSRRLFLSPLGICTQTSDIGRKKEKIDKSDNRLSVSARRGRSSWSTNRRQV